MHTGGINRGWKVPMGEVNSGQWGSMGVQKVSNHTGERPDYLGIPARRSLTWAVRCATHGVQ